jgi:hypothetical protein
MENKDISERWVNIYEDENGRFLSDQEYPSYKKAFENKDPISTYKETVRIARKEGQEKLEEIKQEIWNHRDQDNIVFIHTVLEIINKHLKKGE